MDKMVQPRKDNEMKKRRGLYFIMAAFLLTLQIGIISAQATGTTGSADLSVLTVRQELSNGETKDVTLTPAFSADVTEYNTVLEPTCVKLSITATPADANGTADVVYPEMDPGDNTTYVNVTASDGTTKQYVLYSRVPDASETTTPEPTTPESTTPEESSNDESTDAANTVDNPGDTEDKISYKRVCRVVDERVVYVLVQNVSDTSKVPEGYEETTLEIRNKTVQAWTMGNGSPYYLVYALDEDNNLDLYSYDAENGTMQRFNTIDYGRSNNADAKALDQLQKDYTQMKDELTTKNSLKMKIIILLVLVALIMVFFVINLVLKIKELKSIDDEAYYDEDSVYDDEADDEDFTVQEEYDGIVIDTEEDEEKAVPKKQAEEPVEKPKTEVSKKAEKEVKSKTPKAAEGKSKPEEEMSAFDEDAFTDLNIDLTDSILAELTETSQKLEQSSKSLGKDVKEIVKEKDVKDMEIPSFNTNNLPNPNRFKFDIPDENEDDDFEFFDLDD